MFEAGKRIVYLILTVTNYLFLVHINVDGNDGTRK